MAQTTPPKRSEQRRRANIPAAGVPRRVPRGAVEDAPPADPEWHPVAIRWYEALGRSGQHVFYEPSDWATAFLIASSISAEFGAGGPPSAAALTSWIRAMTSLCVTEGDRRRAGIELVAAEPEADGEVSWIDDARRRLRESG